MRSLYLFALAALLAGCSEREGREKERAALDALLAGGRVQRVEFVNRKHDKTNAIVGERVLDALALFSATNRVDVPPPDTKHYSDWIFLVKNDAPVRLEYYPHQQVLSFRGYRFALRGTNGISEYFE